MAGFCGSPTSFFVAAYPYAGVKQVKDRLGEREQMIGFAQRAQKMEPAELQRAFIEEFGS